MNAEKIAKAVMDRDWEWLDYEETYDGGAELCIHKRALEDIIIEEINNEISKEQS